MRSGLVLAGDTESLTYAFAGVLPALLLTLRSSCGLPAPPANIDGLYAEFWPEPLAKSSEPNASLALSYPSFKLDAPCT